MAWFDVVGAACIVGIISVAGIEYAHQKGDRPSREGHRVVARVVASSICPASVRRSAVKNAISYSLFHPIDLPPWRLPRLLTAKMDKIEPSNAIADAFLASVVCSI